MKLIFFILIIISSVAAKKYDLVMFATTTFTGWEPRDGKTCAASMQVAVDEVNKRDDILPDYNIRVIYGDEGPGVNLSPRSFIEYIWELENLQSERPDTTFMAPVMVGVTRGCHKITKLSQHFKLAQFSHGCSGPQFTARRDLYPHLYRCKIESTSQFLMSLIFAYNRGWKQYGKIYFDKDASINEDKYRDVLENIANPVMTRLDKENFDKILNSDARILYISTGDPVTFINFICEGYKYGVKGPLYLFMTSSSSFINPMAEVGKLPEGCTREILIEQIRVTIWGGPFDFAFQNNGNVSLLNFDVDEFEKRLKVHTGGVETFDYVRRHRCFDSMLLALNALHNTEPKLQRFNMTLRDFDKFPDIVSYYVNESAAESDINGLRIGRLKYSPRLEIDDEEQPVAQWTPEYGLRLLSLTQYNGTYGNDTKDPEEMSSWIYRVKGEAVFYTRDGLPPKDLSQAIIKVDKISLPSAILIFIFSLLSLFILMVSLMKKLNQPPLFDVDNVDKLQKEKLKSIADYFVLIAGFLMTVAAVIIGSNRFLPREVLLSLCSIEICLAVVGVVAMNGMIFFRLVEVLQHARAGETCRNLKKTEKKVAIERREIVAKDKIDSYIKEHTDISSAMSSRALFRAIVFMAINTAGIIVAVKLDPFDYVKTRKPAYFDSNLDSYIIETREFCSSSTVPMVLFIIGGVNLIILLLGVLLNFQTRKAGLDCFFVRAEVWSTKFATINAFTLLAASFLLLAAVGMDATTARMTIVAFALLFYSITCVIITFIPIIWNPEVTLAANIMDLLTITRQTEVQLI